MAAEQQKALAARMEGEFEYVLEMRGAPDGEWSASKGTASYASVLGGRALRGAWKGEGGFESEETIAFDGLRQEFLTVSLDNMSPQPMVYGGTWDEAAAVLLRAGTMDDPMSGARDKAFRTETRFPAAGGWVYSMHWAHSDGREFEVLRATMAPRPAQ